MPGFHRQQRSALSVGVMTALIPASLWAARLGVSGTLVRRWCEQGRVPGAVCWGRSGPPNRRTWEVPAEAPRPEPRAPGRPVGS